MTYRLVLSPLARADVIQLLEWSIDNFGPAIRDAYEVLIDAAFREICADPMLAGSHDWPELGHDVRGVHLSTSRDHVAANERKVVEPRHVVFYRQAGDAVHVARVLHEARNFVEHPFP